LTTQGVRRSKAIKKHRDKVQLSAQPRLGAAQKTTVDIQIPKAFVFMRITVTPKPERARALKKRLSAVLDVNNSVWFARSSNRRVSVGVSVRRTTSRVSICCQ
jgi:hypothetical protein